MRRVDAESVRSGGLVLIPATTEDHPQKSALRVDVMKVNKVPLLVSISWAIKFGGVKEETDVAADTFADDVLALKMAAFMADVSQMTGGSTDASRRGKNLHLFLDARVPSTKSVASSK